jgi:hypothetical protein
MKCAKYSKTAKVTLRFALASVLFLAVNVNILEMSFLLKEHRALVERCSKTEIVTSALLLRKKALMKEEKRLY